MHAANRRGGISNGRRSPLTVWGLFCVLLGVVAYSAVRLEAVTHLPGRQVTPLYLPQARYLRVLSLGHGSAVADLLWFRTISYFGEHYRSDRSYPWLAYMCDQVTDLDPRAEHVYRFAGVILPWEAGDPEAGIRLLEKGAINLPKSWQIPFWLGFAYYFFKDDYRMAIHYLRRAAAQPTADPLVARLLALLVHDRYGPATTLRLLTEVEGTVESEDARAIIRAQREDARFALLLQRLQEMINHYRNLYGYTPESLAEVAEKGILPGIPLDPYGGTFLIDPVSAEVRSSTGYEPSKLHKSKVREAFLQGRQAQERKENNDSDPSS